VRDTTRGRSEDTRSEGRPVAFTSARKMMSWAVPRPNGGYRVYAKGASEIVIGRVTQVLEPSGNVRDLAPEEKDKIAKDVIGVFAAEAMRTIALAYRDLDSAPGDEVDENEKNADGSKASASETQLVLVGITGIEDPLRIEVPGAISKCYRAGIDVRMVTGDNIDTAIAIAKGAGILRTEHFDMSGKVKPFRAMQGKDFRKRVHKYTVDGEGFFQQAEFDAIWPYLRVLARSSPEDKLTLARGLTNSMLYKDDDAVKELLSEGINVFPDGQVVAMTGDGTNDAPALKAAGVGFAMGITGTQIAKDAANIILLDDNFASIVTAAMWGRNVFDSIQKFLQFQLTVNIAVLVLSTIVSFSSYEPPLTVLQMLWLNLIMDSLASLALASEPPTECQLERPPTNRSDFIISSQMWYNMLGQACYQVIVIVCLLFKGLDFLPGCEDIVEGENTGPRTEHYTIIFNTFVLMQLFNEFNSRKLRGEINVFTGITTNPMFVGIMLVTFCMQTILTQFSGKWMKLAPDGLTAEQWGICIAFGAGPLLWQQCINLAVFLINRFAMNRGKVIGITSLTKVGRSKRHVSTTKQGALRLTKSTSNLPPFSTSKMVDQVSKHPQRARSKDSNAKHA